MVSDIIRPEHNDRAERLDVYPVTWVDEDGVARNLWSLNSFTGEIEPDPEGDPLYTTVAPVDVSDRVVGEPTVTPGEEAP